MWIEGAYYDKPKGLREQNKLPQKYIAGLLELFVTRYAGKESGYRKFNPHEAIKLPDFFGIDVRKIIDYLPNDIRNLYIGAEM